MHDRLSEPESDWQTDDSTHATKGLIAGICLSVPIWAVIIAVVVWR